MELLSDKLELKRNTLLPRWLPHAQAYLEGERVYQNPILVYCIIWLFDTGQFELALRWTDIAIEQGQKTPENFKKSELPTFVAHFILGNGQKPKLNAGTVSRHIFSRCLENPRQMARE
ncbi:phage terminase small subunit [Escherichia coli]|nr:phage terminase small subunit [Escherichia coli]